MKKHKLISRAILWAGILTSTTFMLVTFITINIHGEVTYSEPIRLIAVGELLTFIFIWLYSFIYAFGRGTKSAFEDALKEG